MAVLALAVAAGAFVAGMALNSTAGDCTAPVDVVCRQLARTLSERMGIVVGVATAVLVLTFVGLSRLAEHAPEGRDQEHAPSR